MADNKRPLEEDGTGGELVKRQRTENGTLATAEAPATTKDGVTRTSGLLAPTMLLTGHGAEVFSVKFSPDGQTVASGSHDKHIFLWNTYGECANFMLLKGHKNAVLELHWTTDGEKLLSASPDKSLRAWDAQTGLQIKKMAEHDSFVNSCSPLRRGPPLLVSGSDDCSAKLWDLRAKRSAHTFSENYQVVAVAFAEGGDQVYTGGIENSVNVWDLRKGEIAMTLPGHDDTITGLSVSPDGNLLLSNSMDNSLRVWDMRPYAPANRCMKIFQGSNHSFEKNLLKCAWSADGSQISAGSADRMVNIWDASSRKLLYKLPGHNGSVNDVAFHPKEPIVASASSDKNIFLGELAA